MTGWYLQVLQAWKFSLGKWEKKKIDLRSLGNAKIAVIGEGHKEEISGKRNLSGFHAFCL